MAMPSFAFSVHNFISSTGADAGFAAIVGLAILVLLYFAHARETANLQEEAALLTQRLHHAEARVAQLMRMQNAAQDESSDQLPAVAMSPFAQAGTGAPALGSATHVLPLALEIPEPEQPIVVQRPAPAPVPAMAMAGVSAPAIERPPASEEPPPTAPVPPPPVPWTPPPVPAPATNAGGNGHSTDRPSPPPTDGPSPPPAAATAARRASRSLPPLEPPRRRARRSRLGRAVAVALVALAAVAAAVGLYALTSSTGSSPSHSSGARATNAPAAGHRGGTFKPSSITVAVLNGTSVNQLAHRIGAKLAALGFKEGSLATASNQTQSTTTVAYLPGEKNRIGAQHVAAALKLHASAVQPIDQSTLQIACPGTSACAANVVVTVGTDLATQ